MRASTPRDIVASLVRFRQSTRELLDTYGRVYSKKLFLELRLCRYLVESTVVVLASLLESSGPALSAAQRQEYYTVLEGSIWTNREVFEPQLRWVLLDFYSDFKKSSWFKERLEEIVLPLLASMAIQYIRIVAGIALSSLSQLPPSTQQHLRSLMATNPVLAALFSRMSGQGNQNIVASIPAHTLSTVLQTFGSRMRVSVPSGSVGYFEELVRRILTIGRKLNKNDLLDSEFLRFYNQPGIQVLSLDGPFRNIVSTFDSAYANAMNTFDATVRR